MFYTLNEFLKVADIDYRMKDYLHGHLKCECGSEYLINETMTSLICSNVNCKFAGSMRLLSMLRDLGYKGIGPATCDKLCELYDFTNPLNLFAYDMSTDGLLMDSMSYEKCKELSDFLKSVTLPLWKYVYISNIGIRDNAVKIFGGYTSFGDFYTDLAAQSQPQMFIAQKLGVGNVGLSSIKVYEMLLAFKESFIDAEQYLRVQQPRETITIVISQEVKGYTKDAFVKTLMAKYGVDIHRADSVSSRIYCLVTEDAVNVTSNKIAKAKKLGVPIYTPKEFEMLLNEKYGGGDS